MGGDHPAPGFVNPGVARELLHTRAVELRGYKRADGLFDIEGHLVDTKSYDFTLAGRPHPAGKPVHGMWLRITVDRTLTIVDAAASIEFMPYEGDCSRIAPDYRKLIGVAIRPGYQQRLKELFGGVRGCTHVSEMAAMLATAAFQTMAGQKLQSPDQKPFQLDRCHALASTSPVVGRHYPKWYDGTAPVVPADEADHH